MLFSLLWSLKRATLIFFWLALAQNISLSFHIWSVCILTLKWVSIRNTLLNFLFWSTLIILIHVLESYDIKNDYRSIWINVYYICYCFDSLHLFLFPIFVLHIIFCISWFLFDILYDCILYSSKYWLPYCLKDTFAINQNLLLHSTILLHR